MKVKHMLVGALIVAAPFTAAVAANAASDNASPKACFGQDRATWIAEHSGREAGAIISDRAGDNAQINHDYRAGCLPA